ncbi:hypothetical protein ANCCAN_20988 [Ancylostoma caninum]|uniref:PAN domain protein n=1 Tax=Ancylostoma caninum TaxID=29170 RepID=A0A368FLU3_ANCCA|nr:hypothetical protein ANCCAN_20988 [Ancylostoma caninum]
MSQSQALVAHFSVEKMNILTAVLLLALVVSAQAQCSLQFVGGRTIPTGGLIGAYFTMDPNACAQICFAKWNCALFEINPFRVQSCITYSSGIFPRALSPVAYMVNRYGSCV